MIRDEADEGTVNVAPEDAADWIMRSTLPRFLELLTLTDDAAYFSGLEPFTGYTPTGRLRGWQGAGTRLAAVETSVNLMYRRLLATRTRFPHVEPTASEVEARGACVFARSVMLPSRLGWNAYRVIGRSSRLAKYAAEATSDGQQDVEQAWRDVYYALADRAQLRPYMGSVAADR